ncbi:unnamed protein product [Eruca vesicaria subsp. sativa]|uniref:Uncharacterized protein n=1 Tax=Eruca vesicaria subsp. sativa TaxID=29727 RepID=A0ABC8JVK2_ERUVS|nr:unnamed protein product [Eruca vesicaria subsp. sativa]
MPETSSRRRRSTRTSPLQSQLTPEVTGHQDRFFEPGEISIPGIKAVQALLYHGNQIVKPQLLQLCYPHLKVQFGNSDKFMDNAGRRNLKFVIDPYPSLCNVLKECESSAKTISVDSGSGSIWEPNE